MIQIQFLKKMKIQFVLKKKKRLNQILIKEKGI